MARSRGSPPPGTTLNRWLTLAGIVAVALNLRPALTSLAPLITAVRADTGLSAAQIGLLTTLPVLCLGLFGPLAPWLARRITAQATMAIFLAVLALGCGLRAVAPPWGLFLGAILAGAAIGVMGVLLPALLKQDFPHHAAQLTGVYTLVLCLGAGLAAGLTVPAMQLLGRRWEAGLAIWALPALLALIIWLPQLGRTQRHARTGRKTTDIASPSPRPIWRDALAWRVTIFMGLQSSLAYSVFGWLPLIFESRGLSPLQAGLLLSGSLGAQLFTALGAPWIATAWRDQRPAVALFVTLTLSGLLACIFAPLHLAWLWAALLGLGQGGTFSVALVLIVLRSRDAAVAGRLSGMAQGAGYTLAAMGPLLVGILHDWRGDWLAVSGLFCLVASVALWAGLGAGRRGYVSEPLRGN